MLDFPSRALLSGGRGDNSLCPFDNSDVQVTFTHGLTSHQTDTDL